MMDDTECREAQEQFTAAHLVAHKRTVRAMMWLLFAVSCLMGGLVAHLFFGHGDSAIHAPAADVSQADEGS